MVAEMTDHQYVSIKGKVVSVFPVQEINIKNSGKKVKKMDVNLADHTGVHRCVVWEKQIALVEDGKSYKLNNVTVRSFNGTKYISLGENSLVEEIEDIGEVADDVNPEDGTGRAKVVKGDIVGILGNVDTYKSCRSCNGKIIDTKAPIGVCSKCNSKMKVARCSDHTVVNAMLVDENNKEYRVTIFNDIIDQIVMFASEAGSGSGDIEDKLLSVPVLCYTINHKDIVSSVSK